ncbi:hypothetical protein AB0M46_38780 [Dactylosporangium sp. NPDC051485]|uniref:hypothetical protein n=1 Tax=Dactylosporangium sp. NPDC051485 TaxID=3154846 RepID=UPI003437B345
MKIIRYRLPCTAARITRSARRIRLRLQHGWPWALALTRALEILRRIPVPAA